MFKPLKKICLALFSTILMVGVGFSVSALHSKDVANVEAGTGLASFYATINPGFDKTAYSDYNQLFRANVTSSVYDQGWKMTSGWSIKIERNPACSITAPVTIYRVEFTYTAKETGATMEDDAFSTGTHEDNLWIGETESLLYVHYGPKISISKIVIFGRTPARVTMFRQMYGTPRAYAGGEWNFDDVTVNADYAFLYSQYAGNFKVNNLVEFSSSTPVPDVPSDSVQVKVTATPINGTAAPYTVTLTGVVVEPPAVTSVTWNNPTDVDVFEGEQITSSMFDVDVVYEDESTKEGATITQAKLGNDVVDLPYTLQLSDHDKTLKAFYRDVESSESSSVSVTERLNDIYHDDVQINAQNLVAQKAALSFVGLFNSNLDGVCVFDGSTSSSSLTNTWSTLSSLFKLTINMLGSSDKQPFKDLFKYAVATTRDPVTGLADAGDSLQNMLARYDYIYSTHGEELALEDFLSTAANRDTPVLSTAISHNNIENIDSNESMIIVIIIAVFLSTSLIALIIIKRKRA